ncbi:MAG: alpha/beta hydrolase [Desulfocapsaceae bacterium]|nr:alpha/beta hydrolase [Desulfocapsaceae bacterium]
MTDSYLAKITAWYFGEYREGYIDSTGKGLLRYSLKLGNPDRGTIIIVSGRTDFIEKYHETCWDLRDLDYSICLYDHLGQGKSGRQLKDPEKGHIDDFNIYVADLERVIQSVVLPVRPGPVYLLAHSMGSTISILLSRKNPGMVHALLLVAPMLQINAGRFLPPFLVETVSGILCHTGGRHSYVWGGGPFDVEMAFKDNVLTTDSDRFRHNIDLVRNNRALGLGSPTFGWLREAYMAMRVARKAVSQTLCPMIIFAAAEERVVRLREIQNFCIGMACCRLVLYRNCEHELLMERDEIRNDLLRQAKDFLLKQQ